MTKSSYKIFVVVTQISDLSSLMKETKELWMNIEILWVDGKSALIAAGCMATRQFLNVALLATSSDYTNHSS
jgi:hypothetical protein